jgi:hypothetical protein
MSVASKLTWLNHLSALDNQISVHVRINYTANTGRLNLAAYVNLKKFDHSTWDASIDLNYQTSERRVRIARLAHIHARLVLFHSPLLRSEKLFGGSITYPPRPITRFKYFPFPRRISECENWGGRRKDYSAVKSRHFCSRAERRCTEYRKAIIVHYELNNFCGSKCLEG